MNYSRLKELYESDGEARFGANMLNMIHEGKLNADNFSLKGLWEAMGQPDFSRDKAIADRAVSEEEFKEAVGTSVFPKITGALINKMVQEAYDLEYGVGDQLVTKIQATQRDEYIVGFIDDSSMRAVPELMPYQEGGINEKYHKIKSQKWGRIVSISEEMVKFDQTGQVVQRARRVGEMAKTKKESMIFDAITGNITSGDYASWRPGGTATALYNASSADPYSDDTLNNLNTNTLNDQTDIDVAVAAIAGYTDEHGEIIQVIPKILLTAMALIGIGRAITKSMQRITLTAGSVPGVYDTYSSDMGIKHMYSPFIDSKKGAAYWYLGDPRKQFVYAEVFPLQVFQAKKGNDQEFERDVLFRFKSRFMGGCGAVTNRYVMGSTGTT